MYTLIITTNTFVFYEKLIHRKGHQTQFCFTTVFGNFFYDKSLHMRNVEMVAHCEPA